MTPKPRSDVVADLVADQAGTAVEGNHLPLSAGPAVGEHGVGEVEARRDRATVVTARATDEIARRGFAIVEDALDPGEVHGLIAALDRLITEDLAHPDPRRRGDDWMAFNGALRDDAIAAVVEHPNVLPEVEALLGPSCIMYACVSSTMPPNGTNFSRRVHVDSPRVIPSYPTNVGVMFVLTDFTEENGATRFLPGSFERMDPPTTEEFDRDAEMVFPRAGSAVVFNARTWHMGGVNRTSEARHAVTVNYCRAYMRQSFDFVRMVPPDQVPKLSPVLRRLLGFDVRMPTSLDEYYVDEADRLYKANQG